MDNSAPSHSGHLQPSIWMALIATLALAGVLFFPGLSGPFVFDDYSSILKNPQVQITDLDKDSLIQAALGSPVRGLGRPISSLSFGLNHVFAGLNPMAYKATNLIIHLLAGVLVFLFIRVLLKTASLAGTALLSSKLSDRQQDWAALLTTAFWLVHPINVSPALYVVQRMTSLSGLFVIIALMFYLIGRQRQIKGENGAWTWIILSLGLFTPLALFSKENGILAPGLMLAIEVSLLRFNAVKETQAKALKWLFAAIVGLPIAIAALLVLIKPEILLKPYELKPFTLTERLMTEPRIFWFYLKMLLLPSIENFSLYHDDIVISRSLFTPWTTLPSLLALGALLIGAWIKRRQFPLFAFAVVFFVVGHSLESTFLALELLQEHRNYIPSLGVFLALSIGLIKLAQIPQARRIAPVLGLALLILFSFNTALRSSAWGSSLTAAIEEAHNHPRSPRAHLRAGTLYAQTLMVMRHQAEAGDSTIMNSKQWNLALEKARYHFNESIRLSSTNSLPPASSMLLHAQLGEPIPRQLINELQQRLTNPAETNVDHSLGFRILLNVHKVAPEQMPLSQIDQLFRQTLDNPARNPRERANIYALYASFLINQLNDLNKGLDTIRIAVKLAPGEIRHRVSLIHILEAKREWSAALDALNETRALDSLGQAKKELDALEKRIKQKRIKQKRNDLLRSSD